MKRIGLLALALVLALGALGVGYAAWTDTITITGTVNTGSVDLQVVNYSGTWVYKVVENKDYPDEIWVYHGWATVPFAPPAGAIEPAVAYAVALPDGEDAVVVTFSNAFPLEALTADILVHYDGTIPVKVTAGLTGPCTDNTDNGVDDCALLAPYVAVHFFWSDVNGTKGTEILTSPVQMHQSNYVLAVMSLDLPQLPEYMNLSCSFTAEITAIQWNEYKP